jgi:tetratricopeptide (TPR) repeat protein
MKYLIAALFFLSIQMRKPISPKPKFASKKQYTEAQLLFEKSLVQFPADQKTIEYLGDIQCHLGRWHAALPYYQKLKSVSHSKPSTITNTAAPWPCSPEKAMLLKRSP